jgi:hypothetical protein
MVASLICLLAQTRRYSREKDPESGNTEKFGTRCKRALEFVVRNIEVISLYIALFFLFCLSFFWEQVAKTLTGEGEPIVLLQGVSLWPSVMLRLLTVLTSFCLIIRGWRKLRDNLDEIADELRLDRPDDVIKKQLAEQRERRSSPANSL